MYRRKSFLFIVKIFLPLIPLISADGFSQVEKSAKIGGICGSEV
jgi:hypothetical protein